MPVQTPFRSQVTVSGMTCRLCVMSVTEEIAQIPGVSAVDAELESGVVTVVADREVSGEEITAAVVGAGFAPAD